MGLLSTLKEKGTGANLPVIPQGPGLSCHQASAGESLLEPLSLTPWTSPAVPESQSLCCEYFEIIGCYGPAPISFPWKMCSWKRSSISLPSSLWTVVPPLHLPFCGCVRPSLHCCLLGSSLCGPAGPQDRVLVRGGRS